MDYSESDEHKNNAPKMDPLPKFLAESSYNNPSELQYPHLYEVYLLNDKDTPLDFVVFIMQCFFHKPFDEATQMMVSMQNEDKVLCEICTKEVAETRVIRVMDFAEKNGHSLRCVMHKSKKNVVKES